MIVSKLFTCLLILFSPLILQGQSLYKKLEKVEIIVCTHRGAMTPDAPENSIVSMKASLEAGLTMHEIDLAENNEGILYLLHDTTLYRTTSHQGLLSAYTSTELADVKLNFTHEKLPTFESALLFAKQNHIDLMLDVKNAPLQKVIQLVEKHDMMDQIMVLTFSRERAMEALGLNKPFLFSVLISSEEDFMFYESNLKNQQHKMAYLGQSAPLDLFQFAKERNWFIVSDVLHEVDSNAQMDGIQVYHEFLKSRKPDIVVTDYSLILHEIAGF